MRRERKARSKHQLDEWQTAVCSWSSNSTGPTMTARMTKALNRHIVRTFSPDRKDPHWGKRELKRDQ